AKLRAYLWPGNVRELRNAIERAVLLLKGRTIGAGDLALGGAGAERAALAELEAMVLPPEGFDLARLNQVEMHLLRQALERTNHNQVQAAQLLHVSRDRLRYRLQKYGL